MINDIFFIGYYYYKFTKYQEYTATHISYHAYEKIYKKLTQFIILKSKNDYAHIMIYREK